MRRIGLLCLLCFLSWPALGATTAITVCREDQTDFPWLRTDGTGYVYVLLDHVSKKLGLQINIVTRPWKRCLFELEHDMVDAVTDASFTIERQKIGAYPMRGDEPDASKRLFNSSYSLFRKIGSKVDWDGKAFAPSDVVVAAQTSFSIVKQLEQMGVRVDDSSKSAEAILLRLVHNEVALAALQTQEGSLLVSTHLDFRSSVERLPTPFGEKPYFLIFSKRFYKSSQGLANSIWDTIAQVRESQEFIKEVAPLMEPH